MKILQSGIVLLLSAACSAQERRVQSLDGAWMMAIDPDNAGRTQRWFASGPVSGARNCRVPDVLEATFPGYDGVAWYWKTFDAAPSSRDERLMLKFHAADYLAHIWVNGVEAGSHEGGETPFELDISKLVSAGENRLVVRLLNPSNQRIDGIVLNETPRGIKNIPMAVGNFWNPGGLWQSVELIRVPAVRIQDIFTDARLSDRTVAGRLTVANESGATRRVRLRIGVAPAWGGAQISNRIVEVAAAPGQTPVEFSIPVRGARLWSVDDPYLYRVAARLEAGPASDSASVRCGFREFVFRDGYFRLNGKRLFLRGTHSVGHFPIGQHVPHDPELLRRELVYVKTMGFNMVRWLGRTMFPSQLEFCDELGLMVYQESYASWRWEDSPQMKPRFDAAVREMILRDRNHPSVVAWGLLNETRDNPVFRHAAAMLPLIRSLDESRMVFLNSGRWDAQPSIGSISNPRSTEWSPLLGDEGAGMAARTDKKLIGGYAPGAGDLHMYVTRPWTPETVRFFRTVGEGARNVFLSEHGNGSQIDPVRLIRLFEQNGAREDLDDARLYRAMYEQLWRDWKAWKLDRAFTTPSDMVRQGEKLHSAQRLVALNAIRSNPQMAGYSLTGLSDQAVEGEGLMTSFRELKPGIVEAMTDGFAPLRWCVFAEPVHLYRGGSVHVEAVLANEDVLKPGLYRARVRVVGPGGVVFEKRVPVEIPDPSGTPEPPMAFPVFSQNVNIEGPAGRYDIAVFFEGGAAAVGRRSILVGDKDRLPRPAAPVTVWDEGSALSRWLGERGATVRTFEAGRPAADGEVILISANGPPAGPDAYANLLARIREGGTAIFLEPGAVTDEIVKAKLVDSGGMYWGRDDVIVPHAAFEGLPSRRLMDLEYYRDLVPVKSFTDFEAGGEVVVPSFALGRPGGAGYWSGANLIVYRRGQGKVVISTLRLLENLDKHPAADRILLNLIALGAQAHGTRAAR